MGSDSLVSFPVPPIDVVLANTRHAGNIGAVARIMKNMGFESLILVNPTNRAGLEAVRMARGAEELIEKAVIVDSLEDALSCASRAYAVTRRPRKISKTVFTPAQAVAQIASRANERTALVFGSEKLGLSGKDIALCGALVQIPSSQASPSLNLAQAVAVILYEIRREGAEAKEKKEEPLAGIRERLILYRQMEETLRLSGFFKSANPASVMGRLSGIIERAGPDAKEIKALLGAFREMKRAVTGK